MVITRLAAIGFIILSTPTLSSERLLPTLPSTPPSSPPMETGTTASMGLQMLKDSSKFMISEFEDACRANISNIRSFNPDPVKPEGYGNQIQYYTQSDKMGLIGNLTTLLKKTADSVNAKLEALDKEESTKKIPLSNEEVSKHFRDIYGILNEGRKNCSLSLNQIEKQTLRTSTLKDCLSTVNKSSSDIQKPNKGALGSMKKYLPGSRSQKKDQQAESSDVNMQDNSTTNSRSKKALDTPEPKEQQKQRLLLQALEKSGLR